MLNSSSHSLLIFCGALYVQHARYFWLQVDISSTATSSRSLSVAISREDEKELDIHQHGSCDLYGRCIVTPGKYYICEFSMSYLNQVSVTHTMSACSEYTRFWKLVKWRDCLPFNLCELIKLHCTCVDNKTSREKTSAAVLLMVVSSCGSRIDSYVAGE